MLKRMVHNPNARS